MSEIIEKFFISKYVCAICKREHTSKEYAELCYDQDVFIQSTPVIYVEDKEKRWMGYSTLPNIVVLLRDKKDETRVDVVCPDFKVFVRVSGNAKIFKYIRKENQDELKAQFWQIAEGIMKQKEATLHAEYMASLEKLQQVYSQNYKNIRFSDQ